jgi:ankyrin repeat protein
LENSADIEATNTKGETPLFKACAKASVAVSQLLDHKASIASTDNVCVVTILLCVVCCVLPAHTSSSSRSFHTYFLQDNASILHAAAMAASPSAVTKILALDPLQLNAVDTFGRTPLHNAAARGNVHTIETLLAARADIHALSLEKNSVLHEACAAQQTSAALLLITKGADVCAVNEVPLTH